MKPARIFSGDLAPRLATFIIILSLFACSKGGGNKSSASNEGTPSAPVTLTVGTSHTGSIGKFGTSYYRFTTGASSAYRISLTNTQSDLYWTLYGDANFGAFIQDCDNVFQAGNEVCVSSTLAAAKTYSLTVGEDDDVAGTYKLQVDAVAAARAARETYFAVDGTWRHCNFDPRAGYDIDNVLTISSTALERSEIHVGSTDGSCSGTRAQASSLTYTISDIGSATLTNWTDGATTTAPPTLADGSPGIAAPTVARILATASSGAQEQWIWFVDDSIPSAARLYQGGVVPNTSCAESDSGDAQCLVSTEYYTRQ